MKTMTIPTSKFQDMVARAAKGASENKLIAITSMMCIELKNNVLTLTTTDTANYLKVIADKIEGDDMYAVVNVGLFSKLIAKMTSESITIKMTDNSLEVKGNGTYSIPLETDEDGPVQYPAYKFNKVGEPETIHLTSIKNILAINKAAVAKSFETPCLCGYYMGDQIITTDGDVICFNEMRLLKDDALISPEMMTLLSLNTQEKIECYRDGDSFLFETPDVVVYGVAHDGIEQFPVEEIQSYLDEEFGAKCKLPKILLQNVVDRLSLFIDQYDNNGAYFTFTKEGIKVQSKKSSSVELIAYQESQNFMPFMCCVDIPLLREQIGAHPDEFIELWYGHDAAIKMTSGKVTQVISLLEDEAISSNGDAVEA